MTDGPMFLAGIDRSGIGLLGEALEAHPAVAITRRINFYDFYADRFGDLADPVNLDRCLASMLRYSRISRLGPDLERLRAEFQQGAASYARLLRLLQEQNARAAHKSRWGDKSLGAERHAARILSDFPDASILHVVRDPRDRYASQAMHRSAGRGGVGSGAAAWLWSARRARRYGHRHPDRYLVIRYEDLVSEPGDTLRSVCDFVGIELHPAMLQPEGAGPFHEASIGRFRRDLSVGEIRFLERVTGGEMSRWGYAPSQSRWTGPALARFVAAELPVATAGLVLWGPWTSARRRIGSGPSARRTVETG